MIGIRKWERAIDGFLFFFGVEELGYIVKTLFVGFDLGELVE